MVSSKVSKWISGNTIDVGSATLDESQFGDFDDDAGASFVRVCIRITRS